MNKVLIIVLSFLMISCVTLGQPKKRMSASEARRQSQESLDSKITSLSEMTDVQGSDILYIIDAPGSSPASEKITVTNLFDIIDTSAELYGILTDETGSGGGTPLAVFNYNPTLTGFALAADADFGDYDIHSVDGLYGYDDLIYIDMGADGYITIEADTGINITAPTDFGDEDLTSIDKLEGYDTGVYLDLGADGRIIILADGAGTAFSTPDIDITGSVYFDDDIGLALDKALQFGDANVFIESDDDGYLDLDADTGIRLNAASTFTTSISPSSADGGTIGTADLEVSDIYLAASGIIYGQNDQSNTLTSSATGWIANLDVQGATLTATGNITSGDSFIIGSADIEETELEILDGATLSTTQINYLSSATGTTGTTSTNVVFSTSPTLTTPTISGAITNDAGALTDGSIKEADLDVYGSATVGYVLGYYGAANDFVFYSIDVLLSLITPGAYLNSSIYAADISYGDGLTASGNSLVLDLADPHTWTGVQTLADLSLTKRTSAPGSPVAGTIYYADGATWDPSGIYATINKAYYVIYDGSNYIAIFDEDGGLHATSITTVETDYIMVGDMDDTAATNPAALAAVVGGANSRYWMSRAFDGAAQDENLTFNWPVPLDIATASGIKFRWIAIVSNADPPTDTDDEDITFYLQGVSIGDNDSGDPAAFGTAVSSAFGATAAQYDIVFGAWSSAITVTDLAVGEIAHMNLYRDIDAGDHPYDQDINVVGIQIKYKRTHDATF